MNTLRPFAPVKAGQQASRRVQRLMLALDRDERHLTEVFAGVLVSRFLFLGHLAGRAFESMDHATDVSTGKASKDRAVGTTARILAEIDVERWVADEIKPQYEKHFLRVLDATLATVNRSLQLGVELPDSVGRAVVHTGGRRAGLVDFTAQTRRALFRALEEGRSEGMAREQLARHIVSRVAAGRFNEPRTRALLIARTETKYAQNVSTLAVYQQSTAIRGVIAYDNRTGYDDPDCTARDGQTFTFEQAQAEADAEHPNGTLSFAPVVITGGNS